MIFFSSPPVLSSYRACAWVIVSAGFCVFAFVLYLQYLMGLPPCPLCVWQRVAWGGAMMCAALSLVPSVRQTAKRFVLTLALMCLVAGAGVAAYHSGVELGWFGSSCAALGGAQDLESLRQQLLATPIVPCDQVLWSFLSLSLADWNVIMSLLLTVYGWSVIHDHHTHKTI